MVVVCLLKKNNYKTNLLKPFNNNKLKIIINPSSPKSELKTIYDLLQVKFRKKNLEKKIAKIENKDRLISIINDNTLFDYLKMLYKSVILDIDISKFIIFNFVVLLEFKSLLEHKNQENIEFILSKLQIIKSSYTLSPEIKLNIELPIDIYYDWLLNNKPNIFLNIINISDDFYKSILYNLANVIPIKNLKDKEDGTKKFIDDNFNIIYFHLLYYKVKSFNYIIFKELYNHNRQQFEIFFKKTIDFIDDIDDKKNDISNKWNKILKNCNYMNKNFLSLSTPTPTPTTSSIVNSNKLYLNIKQLKRIGFYKLDFSEIKDRNFLTSLLKIENFNHLDLDKFIKKHKYFISLKTYGNIQFLKDIGFTNDKIDTIEFFKNDENCKTLIQEIGIKLSDFKTLDFNLLNLSDPSLVKIKLDWLVDSFEKDQFKDANFTFKIFDEIYKINNDHFRKLKLNLSDIIYFKCETTEMLTKIKPYINKAPFYTLRDFKQKNNELIKYLKENKILKKKFVELFDLDFLIYYGFDECNILDIYNEIDEFQINNNIFNLGKPLQTMKILKKNLLINFFLIFLKVLVLMKILIFQ